MTGGVTIGIIAVSGMISIAGTLGSAANATAGSAASPTPTLGAGSAPAPQIHPTSPWAGSNMLAPMSPPSVYSSVYSYLPPGAAYPGGGEAFALGAAGITLAAGGATIATTTTANSGGNTAQSHGHVETTAPSSHGPFAHMDPIILFLHFQSISSSGLLSLKYPPIYQAFTAGVFVIRRVSINIFIFPGQLCLGKSYPTNWSFQEGGIPFQKMHSI